ncbi:PucR-like helix-turn-helix protein [Kineococcus xinjiangensis]|uniref:PucR-like helix-turn-helix protein n=1 Tax=Kineococcus xinjiangensis TaxID=512762 RepID=A0A2S6ITI0_9ACTN|nr:helix-turn-helix domain-containing protein [Kineococcus xinjiangensis]PPK97356.1 PucR-like helix-turn-helix protein [Kineococcus xinjiangensis]
METEVGGGAGQQPSPEADRGAVRTALLELLGEVDALAEHFVAELTELAPYRDGVVDRGTLIADAVGTYERILRRMLGMPVPIRLTELSREIGRRRAALDIPLAAITRGTRLHFRVVWQRLAHHCPPDPRSSWQDVPLLLWEAVEEHSGDVHAGFSEAAAALAHERDRDRRRIVETLLDGDGGDEALVGQAAAVLGVDRDDDLVVAFVPAAAQQALAAALRARRGGSGAHVHEWRGGTVVLLRASREVGARPRPPLPPLLREVPCALVPLARGLAQVPRAAHVAAEVAATLPRGARGPCALTSAALDVAAARLGDVREPLVREALGGLLALPAPERMRILEVADAYAATGTVAGAAAAAYCHRNTVLNRLRRLQEVSGLDLTVPREGAVLLLALAALGQRREEPRPAAAAGPARPRGTGTMPG